MSINENRIVEWYSTHNEENRFKISRADGIESHFTKKILEKYINLDSSVIEIGCGTGYYGMFLSNKCKNYTGIDLSPKNIELFNEKIKNDNKNNIIAMVGNATNLINIKENNYDVVLVLGPVYHLSPNERELAFYEAKRICKSNGILIFAYLNKLGIYLYGALSFPDIYPNKRAFECALINETDDNFPEEFFLTTPEKMVEGAKNSGLIVLRNLGVDFLFNRNIINNMDEEKFNDWMKYLEYLCENEACAGLSNHTLLICRKL
jgi:ubiquinone/menaquinone biosynthesis C-methylase UbiE